MARIKKRQKYDNYYTVEDIMEILHISRRQVFYYFSQEDDKLQHIQIKHKNYVPNNILSDWLLRNTGRSLQYWIESPN